MDTEITLTVDVSRRTVRVDTRTTLLDALRERLGVIAPKKGCDHGQCGSCTVLLDGRRHLTCLALAFSYDGSEMVGRRPERPGGRPGEHATGVRVRDSPLTADHFLV